MNKNIYICLLIIFIVYLIFKISSNTCNGFSIGYQKKCVNPGPQPNNCPKCCSGSTCIGIPFGGKTMYECKHNPPKPKPPKPPPSGPPKIKLAPKNADQFIKKLQNAYTDPNGYGVFVSMIFNTPTKLEKLKQQITNLENKPKIYLDGSGSIINKSGFTNVFGGGSARCKFGFIWDINWYLNLVECLFTADGGTTPIGECHGKINFCKFANTSKDGKTPDRCSEGLKTSLDQRTAGIVPKNYPNPTNCTQKIIYDMDKFERIPLKKNENCNTNINNSFKKNNIKIEYFNEGVFLTDVEEAGIEISEGIKKLNRLSKSPPVALFYVDNDSDDFCYSSENKDYVNIMKALKSNFTGDTVVIRVGYNNGEIDFSKDGSSYTTLDKMPGYNACTRVFPGPHLKSDCNKLNETCCDFNFNCTSYPASSTQPFKCAPNRI